MPESEILCGLFRALVVITRLPDRDPFALGLKVTLIEQVAFGAMANRRAAGIQSSRQRRAAVVGERAEIQSGDAVLRGRRKAAGGTFAQVPAALRDSKSKRLA